MAKNMIRQLLTRLFAPLDAGLLTPMLLLIGCGLMVLYSAAGEDSSRVVDQLRNLAVAISMMWIVALIPSQYLLQAAAPIYAIGVVLLVGVALFGDISNGARRWLNIGVTRIQPSELMKIAMPLMLAWYFHKRESNLRLFDFMIAAILLGIPVLLIVKQPDLGTALLIAASGFYVLFLAGLSWKVLVGLGVLAAASIPVAWPLMHDYQRQRVLTLLDPAQDPLGAGYHTIQSTIALGSGGISGKGWMNGTQAHLDFLPERTTDFIFAVYGEEFGLIGNLVLLILYLALIVRGMMIAYGAGNLFGRLVAGALTLTLFTYAFVNMGMVSGILPVVGVPLPLVSYGGTALVTILTSLGILMGIQSQKKLVQT
jgi:rod shape determining protein RodA